MGSIGEDTAHGASQHPGVRCWVPPWVRILQARGLWSQRLGVVHKQVFAHFVQAREVIDLVVEPRDEDALAEALQAIDRRLIDLHPTTKACYYHPDMLGSWSIKAVLPTIAPDMDYAALEGIHEGTEASAAYLEAIRPETPPERREEIRANLLKYCKHDTEAMVRLVRFFENEPPD